MSFDFKKIDAGKIAAVVLLIVLAVFAVGVIMNRSPESPSTVGNGRRFTLPEGRQVYHISQAEEIWPKFVEAIIDPVDVHVGNTQKLSVIIDDDAEIVSVEAHIETDHDIVVLPLEFVGQTESEPLSPEEIIEKQNIFKEFLRRFQSMPKQRKAFLYEGSWIVKDTHDDTYHTVFIAKDAAGRENTITLAWSDACGIPMGGNATLSSNCSISAPDGVDNGNLIINPGVTLTLDSTFAFNSGKTITVNGAIALGENGVLRKTNIWMVDADNDTYPASASQNLQDSAPTNGKRRYLLNSGGIDCNDNSASVYPGTVTSGSCSCSYSSTCDEYASGTMNTTTCNADGTFSGGSTYCECSRSREGYNCGTTYVCGDYTQHPPYGHRFSVPTKCTGGSCSYLDWGSATDQGCSTQCTGCCSTSDCPSDRWCNTVSECDSCSNLKTSCSGGTACNQCATAKPWYCSCSNYISTSHCSGYQFVSSVQRCSTCGCSAGQTCQGDGTCL